MNNVFAVIKFLPKVASECEPTQLLEVLRNTTYLITMLQTITEHCTINAVYTNGLNIYDGKRSLTALAVDTTPALSHSIIEILNNKFVPGYTEFSNIVDGLNGTTILLPVQFMNCSIADWVEVVGWESVLPDKAKECCTVADTLKLSAKNAPNELKLVYLFELLIKAVTDSVSISDNVDVLEIQQAFPEYRQVIGILHNFRNSFVHSGFVTSYGAYLQLELHYKEQIEMLAHQFDIELNWDHTLYSKGE